VKRVEPEYATIGASSYEAPVSPYEVPVKRVEPEYATIGASPYEAPVSPYEVPAKRIEPEYATIGASPYEVPATPYEVPQRRGASSSEDPYGLPIDQSRARADLMSRWRRNSRIYVQPELYGEVPARNHNRRLRAASQVLPEADD
jgi:hypothetical protein